MAFYLAIVAAVAGYIFGQQNLPRPVKIGALWVEIIVTLLTALAAASMAWGIHKGLVGFEHALKALNPIMFQEVGLAAYIARGRRTVWTVLCLCFFGAVVLSFGISFVLWQ